MPALAKAAPFILLLLVGAWCAEAVAEPPPHAPAHGWRKKHDPHYVGYTGKQWEHDYDILSGRCNREAVATVLGSVVGAVVGSRTAEPEDRTVATIIGRDVHDGRFRPPTVHNSLSWISTLSPQKNAHSSLFEYSIPSSMVISRF